MKKIYENPEIVINSVPAMHTVELAEENIKNTYLNPTSPLFEETTNLLKQEVREPAIYNAIITAIATGASRMSEISSKVGEDTNVCSIYLKNLLSLSIVQKETPYGEKASRKSIYSVEDNMFRFWYRFVPENNSIIARGADDLAYKRIEPHLSEYMGRVFEEICKQYLWKQLLTGNSPVDFTSLGRWWGNDPKSKSQTEIDIMGEADKNTALFGAYFVFENCHGQSTPSNLMRTVESSMLTTPMTSIHATISAVSPDS